MSVCPTEAIHDAQELPPHEAVFAAVNREFFGPDVSGLGSPGGADGVQPSACDHPMVAAYPARVASVSSRSFVRAYPRTAH